MQVRLADEALDPVAALAQFTAGLGDEGAVVSFIGLARATTKEGGKVDRLFLDHHPRLTEKSLTDIAAAARARFDVSDLLVLHRCGEILPREPIVVVAAASSHRRAAFEAVDYLMDRLKTEAVFWKREDNEIGSKWIEPTQADYIESDRWSDE